MSKAKKARAIGFNHVALEVDEDDFTAGFESLVNGSHRFLWVLEVVIGVADVCQID